MFWYAKRCGYFNFCFFNQWLNNSSSFISCFTFWKYSLHIGKRFVFGFAWNILCQVESFWDSSHSQLTAQCVLHCNAHKSLNARVFSFMFPSKYIVFKVKILVCTNTIFKRRFLVNLHWLIDMQKCIPSLLWLRGCWTQIFTIRFLISLLQRAGR